MLIETALLIYLKAQTALTEKVASRIYPVHTPSDSTTLPYIVFTKIDSPEVGSQDGPAGLSDARFQFDVFAASNTAAKEISAILKTLLAGYAGIMGGSGGLQVTIPEREDEQDLYEETKGFFHVASDYIISYEEF